MCKNGPVTWLFMKIFSTCSMQMHFSKFDFYYWPQQVWRGQLASHTNLCTVYDPMCCEAYIVNLTDILIVDQFENSISGLLREKLLKEISFKSADKILHNSFLGRSWWAGFVPKEFKNSSEQLPHKKKNSHPRWPWVLRREKMDPQSSKIWC